MELARHIDHAILKPTQTDDNLKVQCDIAREFEVASVCVKPYHVKLAKQYLKGSIVEVCAVIGFPHGNSTIDTKVFEAREAIENGASEIDVVVNIGKVIEGDFEYIKNEIGQLVDTAHSKGTIIKIIFETVYLNKDQKIKLCHICSEFEADYVKTSTGFATFGAMLEDIELMKENISNGVKIKASGGIRTREEAESFIKAGCQRIGLSLTKEILNTK